MRWLFDKTIKLPKKLERQSVQFFTTGLKVHLEKRVIYNVLKIMTLGVSGKRIN